MHGGGHFSLELDGFLVQPEALSPCSGYEPGKLRHKEENRKDAKTKRSSADVLHNRQ
jgi:hypothetical protein